jgi:predicted acetyltransferase
VLFEELSDERFAKRFKNRLLILCKKSGRVEAMATYIKEGFLTEGKLAVGDFFWTEPEARDQIFAYLALHRDQISRITLTLPYDTNIHAMIPAIEDRVDVSYHGAPWMVRIVDAATAFDELPCQGDLDVTLKIADPICEWNNRTVRLTSHNGRVTTTQTDTPPDIELTVSAASALLYGTLPPAELAREHQPLVHNNDAWAALTEALPEKTLFNDYWF